MKIHMLGIKGTGMSSLALIYSDLGYEVSGSDYQKWIFTQDELIKRNIKVNNFSLNNVDGINKLVVGHDFIGSDNLEIKAAKNKNIDILEYNEAIQELAKDYYSIAICGSNGKSTTTGLIVSILNQVETTSYLIGSGEGFGNKKSKYFVFEACEYKRHFLKYFPDLILINNIDYDHIDYFKSKADYKKAFYEFIKNSRDKVIVNGDDKNLKGLKNTICFGIKNKNMFNARNISYNKGISYDLYYKNQFVKRLKLNMYGKHMVYNTLAAISVCASLGIEYEKIEKGLNNFQGVKRRFKETIINGDVYIDDYAHHPSKIKAMIEAVKSKYQDKKIVVFYRPDRVSRLDYFSKEFDKELLRADKAYILPYLNRKKEEEESLTTFLKRSKGVKLLNDEEYLKVSKMNNVVYLMMSSKDISEVKEKIIKCKGD